MENLNKTWWMTTASIIHCLPSYEPYLDVMLYTSTLSLNPGCSRIINHIHKFIWHIYYNSDSQTYSQQIHVYPCGHVWTWFNCVIVVYYIKSEPNQPESVLVFKLRIRLKREMYHSIKNVCNLSIRFHLTDLLSVFQRSSGRRNCARLNLIGQLRDRQEKKTYEDGCFFLNQTHACSLPLPNPIKMGCTEGKHWPVMTANV